MTGLLDPCIAPLPVSEAEFSAMAAQDRQALKDKIDRRTTAAVLGITVRTLDRGTTRIMGRSAYLRIRSATAAPESRRGLPRMVEVPIAHLRKKEANVADRAAPAINCKEWTRTSRGHEQSLHERTRALMTLKTKGLRDDD
jgi:hypothetical protein